MDNSFEHMSIDSLDDILFSPIATINHKHCEEIPQMVKQREMID